MASLDGLANIKPGILAMKSIVHGGKHYIDQSSSIPTLIDFSTSVNPFGPSPRVKEAIIKGIDAIAEYPDNSARRLRMAAAEYIGVDDGCIVAGNGSSELIYLIADALIDEGDRVLIVEPTFSEYERASLKNSAVVEHVMLNGFTFKDEHLNMLDGYMHGAKLLFICNPNNPTGLTVERGLLLRLVEEAYNEGVMVVLDECFMEFSSIDCSLARYVEEFNNLIVLRSLTKAFGLAGLRIGYCVTNSRLAGILADAKVPWSINALAEVAGVEALKDIEYVEMCRALLARERDYIHDRVESIGYSPLRSDVNFLLIKTPEGINSTALRDMLLLKGIIVRDCSNFFGLDDGRYIRVASRLRDDNELLIDAMEAVLKR